MPISKEKVRIDELAVTRMIDQALEEVRSCPDVASLHAYRRLFRQRVPLHFRAYVAARLIERALVGGRDVPKKGQRGDGSGKNGRSGRNERGAASTLSAEPGPKPKGDKAQKAGRRGSDRKAEAGPSEDTAQPTGRQRRYRGDGVVLFVNAGRRQRFYARVAIAMLNDAPGVGEDLLGDVRTMDNYSFIEVAPEAEEAAIAALDGADFRGRALVANRARKRGEAAPEAAADTAEPSLGASGGDMGWDDSEDLGQDHEGQPGVDGESPEEAED